MRRNKPNATRMLTQTMPPLETFKYEAVKKCSPENAKIVIQEA